MQIYFFTEEEKSVSLLTKKEETPIMKKNIIVRIILQNIVERREGVGVAAANRYSFGRP